MLIIDVNRAEAFVLAHRVRYVAVQKEKQTESKQRSRPQRHAINVQDTGRSFANATGISERCLKYESTIVSMMGTGEISRTKEESKEIKFAVIRIINSAKRCSVL